MLEKMDGDMNRVEHPVPSTILHILALTHGAVRCGYVSVLEQWSRQMSESRIRNVFQYSKHGRLVALIPYFPQSSLNLKLLHVPSMQMSPLKRNL